MAEKLLDFSRPFDVGLLDATVAAFCGTGSEDERAAAERVLRQLQEHPDTWTRVVTILQNSSVATKFYALRVLEGVIKYRWNALPVEQRDGIKNYISDLIVQLSSNEASFQAERLYVNQLNIILVQVLKHEWPARWPSFTPNLVVAAKRSETLCENYMVILKLLSEEVFDFSRGELTQSKIKELKNSLNSEFQLIHELCQYVLLMSQRPELIRATLATLHAFLSWIPVGYIFESTLLETLLKLFPVAGYRDLTLQCLSEVAVLCARVFSCYDTQFANFYTIFMVQLQIILPPGTNVPEAYGSGSDGDQVFIKNLAMFIIAFFKCFHCSSFLSPSLSIAALAPQEESAVMMGLEYLICISYVDNTEIFKVCLDYWNSLAYDLFQSEVVRGMLNWMRVKLPHLKPLYAEPLSKLRLLMISRMAKPEEVLIVEDENGNIVRETMKDNDVLVQYKIMRETLIYLSHLDPEDTEKQMLKKLNKQLNAEEWAWNNLNTVCWAIGSISGSMVEDQENRFLVTVIRDLLNLCEITNSKDNKAVVASNIMYIVGQYPRFLRAHWKLLKTVVIKLFEFMRGAHPIVQTMACDTFLKIVRKCTRKFVVLQVGESKPFVHELLKGLPTFILDQEAYQIQTFYEAVGFMIQVESDSQKQDEYLRNLMELPNQRWAEIITQARQSVEYLKALDVVRAVLNILQVGLIQTEANPQRRDENLRNLMELPNQRWLEVITQAHQSVEYLKAPDVVQAVLNILQLNTSVASSLGQAFLAQISLIYLDMLNVYRVYSELISSSIAEGGPYTSRNSFVKLLRSVKRETLKLIETFVDKADDAELIAKNFVPAMTDPILGDYVRSVSDARESEVLSLFTTIINKLKSAMMDHVPRIFDAVFACTLDMITKNSEDYPEHRLKFFSLLLAIARHCFRALFTLSSEDLKLVMYSIIWAFGHTERNVAETGLNLLLEMLTNFQASEFCNQFHQTYFLTIEQEIFAVLTDSFHKPGFKLHVLILQHLFCLVDSGALTLPLWDAATLGSAAFPNNMEFVRDYSIKLLGTSFPNMTPLEVTTFVNGLFDTRGELGAFKNQLRDFLIQSKEFSAQDNKDLYAEETAAQREAERRRMLTIPGLIAPVELEDDMTDQ